MFGLPAHAQSPAPLPQPDVQVLAPGRVEAVVRQADGGVVFGGRFTSVNGTPRMHLARLLPDGTLDPAFAPTFNAGTASVDALAQAADGSLYVAGGFSQVNGQTRIGLAKLSSTGIVDPVWNPNVDGSVQSLALGPADDLYLAGFFDNVGGLPRTRLAKVSAIGGGAVDPAWQPLPTGTVQDVVAAADGAVFLAGLFSAIDGVPRAGLAKLAPGTGALDAAWNPAPTNSVNGVLLHGGSVYLAGLFESIGGVSRQRLAKLSPDGGGAVDPDWNPGANAAIGSIVLDASGQLLVTGSFTVVGGQTRPVLARLSPNGSGVVDTGLNVAALIGSVQAMLPLPDGRIVLGGSLSGANGDLRIGLVHLSSGGATLPTVTDTEIAGLVRAITSSADGAITVGGTFHRIAGQPRSNLARFLADGSLDPDWIADVSGSVSALAIDATGALIAGGAFSRVNGVQRGSLVRLVGNEGTVDPTWNPSTSGGVSALAVDAATNTLYVGGSFTSIASQPVARLAKLSAAGSGVVDIGWAPVPDSQVNALALDGAGHLFAGGLFSSIGGQPRSRLAKIAATGVGSADPAWNPSPNGAVNALAVRSNGDVYVGGSFNAIGGASRLNLARIAGDGAGAADPAFAVGASSAVLALAADLGDVLYVGGGFGTLGTASRARIGKIAAGGTVDAAWNPGTNSNVLALQADGLGALYVGSAMSVVGGQARQAVAALPAFHNVTYSAGANGSIGVGGTQIVQHGGTGTSVEAIPATGFRFTSWSDGNTQNPRTDANIVADLAVTAAFGNDPPQIVSGTATPATLFEAESSIIAIGATDAEGALTYAFDCGDDGNFEIGPQPDNQATCLFPTPGARNVRVRVADAPGLAAFATVGITVQDSRPQVALTPSGAPLEDAPVPLNATASSPSQGETVVLVEVDCDFDGSSFDVDVSAMSPVGLACPGYATGGVRTIALRARDNEGETGATQTADVDVIAVNDAPVFVVGADAFVAEDASAQRIDTWTSAASPGSGDATDETTQLVHFEIVGNSNAPLFSVAPQVDAEGTLDFAPAPDANGVATLSIRACDDGASEPPNMACSDVQTFSIHVATVNDAPTLQVGEVAPEPPASAGARSIVGFASFDAGPDDEDASQTVDAYLVDAILDPDAVLVPASLAVAANGTLGYTLSGNSGNASIALRVRDTGGTGSGGINLSATQLFSLRVGAGADLQVAMDNGVSFLIDGETTLYAIVVANAGPNAVDGGILTDRLPATLVNGFWACVQAQSTASCPTPGAGAGDLEANINLGVGEHLRFDLVADVDAGQGAFTVNIAEVALPDDIAAIDASNDRATDEDPIRPIALFRAGFEAAGVQTLALPGANAALRAETGR